MLDSRPLSHSTPNITQTRPYYSMGRSMRTVRSNVSENLTDSVVDLRLGELAAKSFHNSESPSSSEIDDLLEVSTAFSDFSACSSDVSVELQRLAKIHGPGPTEDPGSGPELEPCPGFLQRETFSTEIIDSISPEDLQPTVKLCVVGLRSASIAVRRSAAAKLRLLAKNRADNRALIGESDAVPALIPLLRCSDAATQEHAVTALFNLSLHESNKCVITNAGAIKALIYVLKTGTDVSKQNAACALLSLALVDEYKLSIGASGAIPPLVALLVGGSDRGKKDALTTLYKLCSVRLNKERAVSAGAVRPLVGLVSEKENGLAEKAMVVLNSLGAIKMGQAAIVEEGGLPALVEAVEDGSDKGKEFAVLTLLQLCSESVGNRRLLVREGGIPALMGLLQSGKAKAKHKAERLLVCLREEARGEDGCSSSSS